MDIQDEVERFLTFLGAEKPKPGSVFFLVMGMTGSGKSSFIADSLSREDVGIGHGLSSCTSSVGIYETEMQGRTVYLIDTPGFDDTNESDMSTFIRVVHFLSVSYLNNVSLNGIIYLHSISDTRLAGSSRQNLELMKRMCGSDAYSSVTMVLNMWSPNETSDEFEKQIARESQLRNEYLEDMVDQGTRTYRLPSTVDTGCRRQAAAAVLDEVFHALRDEQVTLQIQSEMIDEQLGLNVTSSGMFLTRQMEGDQDRYKAQMEELKTSLEASRETTARKARESHDQDSQLEEENSRLRSLLEKSLKCQEGMGLSIQEIHKREHQRSLQAIRDLEDRIIRESEEKKKQVAESAKRERELMEAFEQEKKDYERREQKRQQRERQQQVEAEAAWHVILEQEKANLRKEYEVQERKKREMEEHERKEQADAHASRMALMEQKKIKAKEEHEKQAKEFAQLVARKKKNLKSTKKVKNIWFDPVVGGVLSGGMGIAGALLAGMLCNVQ